MKKRRNVAISYAGVRILLDTVATYHSFSATNAGRNEYGVSFLLRSGEIITAQGDDEVSRDNVLVFLDDHFSIFSNLAAHRCDVCANKVNNCSSDLQCYHYKGHPSFVRKEE